MLPIEPKSGALALLPIAQRNATGISESPMTVMIVPVTTGGKSRTSWAKNGRQQQADQPGDDDRAEDRPQAARTGDRDHRRHTRERDALDDGSWAPTGPMPRVCSSVASPLTNSPAVTSRAMSPGDRPAAPPTISGGAMTPPYIVRMCCVAIGKQPPEAGTSRPRGARGSAGFPPARLSRFIVVPQQKPGRC